MLQERERRRQHLLVMKAMESRKKLEVSSKTGLCPRTKQNICQLQTQKQMFSHMIDVTQMEKKYLSKFKSDIYGL